MSATVYIVWTCWPESTYEGLRQWQINAIRATEVSAGRRKDNLEKENHSRKVKIESWAVEE